MLTLVASALLLVSPSPRCVSIGLSPVALDPVKGTFFSEYFEQQLTMAGVRLTTRRDIETLLGLERQAKLLGCSDEACLAELALAVNADAVLLGTLAQVGEEHVFTAKVITARDGAVLAAVTGRAKTEGELLGLLEREASAVARSLGVERQPAPARRWAWVPAAAGGVALVAGVGLFASAKVREGELRAGAADVTSHQALDRAITDVERRQSAGLVVGAVAVSALLAAGGMYLFGGTVTGGVAALPGGGAVVVQGRLP